MQKNGSGYFAEDQFKDYAWKATAAVAASYEFSWARQEHAVWGQVALLPPGSAKPAVLSSRSEVNSALQTEWFQTPCYCRA